MFISQPNNFLITRMGLSTLWTAPGAGVVSLAKFQTSGSLNVSRLLRLIFKCGIVYSHHPFFHKFFVDSDELLSLPVYITEDTFPKFYRIHRLKTSLNFTLKRNLMLRRTLQFLNLSSVTLFRLSSWILVSMYIHMPSIVKFGKPSDVARLERKERQTKDLDEEDMPQPDESSYWRTVWRFYELRLLTTSLWNTKNIF